jgi:hypothetical protein
MPSPFVSAALVGSGPTAGLAATVGPADVDLFGGFPEDAAHAAIREEPSSSDTVA